MCVLLFESHCVGYVIFCMGDALAGMACCVLVVLESLVPDISPTAEPSADHWPNFGQDMADWNVLEAARLAALFSLIAYTASRLIAAKALHPYTQPLLAPIKSPQEATRSKLLQIRDPEAVPRLKSPLSSPSPLPWQTIEDLADPVRSTRQ
jgi:hypothetical protein